MAKRASELAWDIIDTTRVKRPGAQQRKRHWAWDAVESMKANLEYLMQRKNQSHLIPGTEHRELHKYLICAACPHLFSTDWPKERAAVMAYLGTKSDNTLVAYKAERNAGKTVFGAMAVAAVAYSLAPYGYSILIMATTLAQGKIPFRTVVDYLKQFPDAADVLEETSQECTVNRGGMFQGAQMRTIIKVAATGNTDALRGNYYRFVWVDEADFIKQTTLVPVIMPMLRPMNVVGFFSTSPKEPGHVRMLAAHFRAGTQQLVTLVGTPVHILRKPAGHRADERREQAFVTYFSNYRNLSRQELKGVSDDTGAFPAEHVKRMFESPQEVVNVVPYLFACVDPSGGGSSATAVVIGTFDIATTKFLVSVIVFTRFPPPRLNCRLSLLVCTSVPSSRVASIAASFLSTSTSMRPKSPFQG